jgi:ribosomal protein S21
VRRFKTSIDKSGFLREYKRKRYFKSEQERWRRPHDAPPLD